MNDNRNVPTVETTPVTREEQSVLANLYQLYIHDFTDFVDLPLGEDGRFAYDRLPAYWTAANHFAFLIKVDDRLAGFALVKKGSDFSNNADVWDMADFFIIRGFRHGGVETEAARQVWAKFPGLWEVRIMTNNIPALGFWTKAVTRFTGVTTTPKMLSKGYQTRYLFQFCSEKS